MDSQSLKLTIITPKGLFLEEMVTEVYAPGCLGITGVLKNHITLVARLEWGELRYKPPNHPQKFLFIGRGYLEVENNIITVLSEKVEKVENLSFSDIQEKVVKYTGMVKEAYLGETKEKELEEALKNQKIFQAKLSIIKKTRNEK